MIWDIKTLFEERKEEMLEHIQGEKQFDPKVLEAYRKDAELQEAIVEAGDRAEFELN